MHETRLTADAMLAEGNIEAAEAYMEARRQIFLENGYSIRKLNQAWFAFHGAYADLPGGAAGAAENPVGDTVRQLRAQSNSLNDFLFRISWIWSFEQLEMLVD
jgi:acetoin utilization deacetylase AcuC-like enzyme